MVDTLLRVWVVPTHCILVPFKEQSGGHDTVLVVLDERGRETAQMAEFVREKGGLPKGLGRSGLFVYLQVKGEGKMGGWSKGEVCYRKRGG